MSSNCDRSIQQEDAAPGEAGTAGTVPEQEINKGTTQCGVPGKDDPELITTQIPSGNTGKPFQDFWFVGYVRIPNLSIMKANRLLSAFTFLSLAALSHGKKDVIDQLEKWNYREGGKVNLLGTRSITRTLEKWGNEIFSEGKNILMYQPQSLLPDYNGIRSFAEAIDDLLRDVNSLKKRLSELNDRLDSINRSIIRMKLHMAPKNPATYPRTLRAFPQRQEKLTHPPNRPFSVKRRYTVMKVEVAVTNWFKQVNS
ncbi:unnamed protein product [Ranitomeya imitator]|uniref:Uncharacterized protein n=1 Tax=Ranitomeya imitator TaxID=111125 RepID=A0ABN9M276_9NEOB|nr:unnamed protein product [Ranitomeya imitator]